MSASVEFDSIVLRNNETGEVFNIEDGIVLTSYSSKVAVYDRANYKLYMLPRYEYSNTTWKHIHAFIDDFTYIPSNWGAVRLRDEMKLPNGDVVKVDEYLSYTHWFRW